MGEEAEKPESGHMAAEPKGKDEAGRFIDAYACLKLEWTG
jgi:hypothetical protein